MLIDFDKIDETVIPRFRGGELSTHARMYSDPNMKIMHGMLPAGASIGLHAHVTSSEIIYILSGHGMVLCDGERELLSPGSCHYCPKGHQHSLINNNDDDLVFFAVVPEQ